MLLRSAYKGRKAIITTKYEYFLSRANGFLTRKQSGSSTAEGGGT